MRPRISPDLLLALAISLILHVAGGYALREARFFGGSDSMHPVEAFRIPVGKIERIELSRPRPKPIDKEEILTRASRSFDDLKLRAPELPPDPPLIEEQVLRELEGPERVAELPFNASDLAESLPPLEDQDFEVLGAGIRSIEPPETDLRDPLEIIPIAALMEGALPGGTGGGLGIPAMEEPPPVDVHLSGPMELGNIQIDIPEVTAPDLSLEALDLLSGPGLGADLPSLENFSPPPDPVEADAAAAAKIDAFVDVSVSTYRDQTGQGFFELVIRPNEQSGRLKTLSKDVLFVLDASNSMGGDRLYQLKSGVYRAIIGLEPEDRFNIVGFRSRPEPFRPELIPVTAENRSASLDFLNQLMTGGHTKIYASLRPFLQRTREETRPLVVLLFSDGRPTVGVTDTRTIIKELTAGNVGGATIFALGSGRKRQINRYLLEMLTYLNRGFVEFAYDISTTREAVLDLTSRLGNPLLVDIKGDFGSIPREEVFPSVLPDLYREGLIRIYGKFNDEEGLYFRLEGSGAEGNRMDYVAKIEFPETPAGGPGIARNWAFHKVYSLIGEICLEGSNVERVQSIAYLSALYDIRTLFND